MDTTFISINIRFRSELDIDKLIAAINIGATYLEKEGREWMLDVKSSEFTIEPNRTTLVECNLDSYEEARETFPDCDFNLTDVDLATRELDMAEMYLTFEDDAELDYESEVESITLFFKQGDCTYCLELESEMFEIVK